jgi:hypothetical protein
VGLAAWGSCVRTRGDDEASCGQEQRGSATSRALPGSHGGAGLGGALARGRLWPQAPRHDPGGRRQGIPREDRAGAGRSEGRQGSVRSALSSGADEPLRSSAPRERRDREAHGPGANARAVPLLPALSAQAMEHALRREPRRRRAGRARSEDRARPRPLRVGGRPVEDRSRAPAAAPRRAEAWVRAEVMCGAARSWLRCRPRETPCSACRLDCRRLSAKREDARAAALNDREAARTMFVGGLGPGKQGTYP